jgi:hypothetical protein
LRDKGALPPSITIIAELTSREYLPVIEESFRPSRMSSLVGSFGAALIIGVSVFTTVVNHHWVIGLLGILGGVVLGISPFQFLCWRQPTVTLSPAGFKVTLPSLSGEPYSSGLVAWNSVLGVSMMRGGSHNPGSKIFIQIKQVKEFSDGSPMSSTVKIPGEAIDIRPSELMKKIQLYLEAAQP